MPAQARVNVQNLVNQGKVTAFQWRVLALCLVVLVLDGFDVVAMGFIAPALVSDWHIPREALGPVLSAGLFGLALGAISGGPLADRFGRRWVIISSMLFFGAMSLASAWSTGVTSLMLFRFLTGLGLGASQPNAATLVSEYAPERHRSLFVTVVYCGFTLGAAGGGFLSAGLIGSYGWPSILVVGGVVPLVLALVYVALLPESIRFLTLSPERRPSLVQVVNRIAPGTADERTEFTLPEVVHRNRNSLGLLFSRPYLTPTLALWVGLFMNLLTVYLLNSWLPIMIRDAGFSIADAALIGTMLQVGGTLGNICIGWGMDRFGPHLTLVGTLILAGLFAVAIGVSPTDVRLLMALLFCLGFCINSSNTGWTALAALFYPTEMRATGTSVMTGVGRFGAIFGATVGAVVLGAGWNFSQIFMFLAAPVGIAVLAALVKASRTRAAVADAAA